MQPVTRLSPIQTFAWFREQIVCLPEETNRLGGHTWGSGFCSPVEFHKDRPNTTCSNQEFRSLQGRVLLTLNIEFQQIDMVDRMIPAKLIEGYGFYTLSARIADVFC